MIPLVDVHITSDDYILMFHDHNLGRTTRTGTGSIKSQPYADNIEHFRTKKLPEQKIPTFDETLEWLSRPENSHMIMNVSIVFPSMNEFKVGGTRCIYNAPYVYAQVDIKPSNDPLHLFTLMRKALERYPGWEESIAPRIVLGLWHPKFVDPALSILPSLRRCFIGVHLGLAQAPVFWDTCDAFSISFPLLTIGEGPAFRAKCKSAGKKLYAWTMNRPEEWALGIEWGVDVIMTDTPNAYIAFRKRMQGE
jgi:phosphatidylglycerol phospholipase C